RAGASKNILIPLRSLPFDRISDAFVRGVVEGADLHGRQVLIHGTRALTGAAGARAWAQLRPEVLIADADQLPAEAVQILPTAGCSSAVSALTPHHWDVRSSPLPSTSWPAETRPCPSPTTGWSPGPMPVSLRAARVARPRRRRPNPRRQSSSRARLLAMSAR